jgi:hypothetical protein
MGEEDVSDKGNNMQQQQRKKTRRKMEEDSSADVIIKCTPECDVSMWC